MKYIADETDAKIEGKKITLADGRVLMITQSPYSRGWDDFVEYIADALDSAGTAFRVVWSEGVKAKAEDESDAADWSKFSIYTF